MKTAVMWTIGTIGFFYGGSWIGPTPKDSNALGFLIIAVSFGVPLFVTLKKIGKQNKARQALFIAAKALYDKSLFDLQEHPLNSAKHQEALKRGREYYGYLHPNTHDVNGNGVSSNFRDNSGIVETKVQSDIQARTMKGNVS